MYGVRGVIRITLRGDPGMRTGTIELYGTAWPIVTWFRQSGGEVHATTDKAERVTLAMDAGTGGITIGGDWWQLSGCKWTGPVMTGDAVPGRPIDVTLRVTDEEMAAMFPDGPWG